MPIPVLAAAFVLSANAEAASLQDVAPYLMADRATEVALARTAAPTHVSGGATVLVLDRDGFVEASRGTNGFTCLVVRSFGGSPDDPTFWNPRVRAPHCFNPPAVRTVLPQILAQTKWVLGGAAAGEIRARIARAYASHEFPMPESGAMAFMLSPQQHLLDSDPHWMPHLMLYYDRSLPAAAWGAGDMSAAVIDGSAGDPQSPVLVLLIPVQRWSDGTPALAAAAHR